MAAIVYPQRPPEEPRKPVFGERGRRREEFPGLWMTHDPAVFYDEATETYYVYSTGAVGRRSRDLLTWENIGKVVPDVPEEAAKWTKSRDIWAPELIKVGSEYRLYCSNSSWGVQQSCIFLAVSDSAAGPFLPRGIVLKTSDALPCNGIDASIARDAETGDMYMTYGSFWGGVHQLRLDEKTGLAAETGVGRCLACRPKWTDRAIEGPHIVYLPETGYYYLFVSYASLKSDYNVRVGRSKRITGPYLDYHGRALTDEDDPDCSVGLMVNCGYRWCEGTPYMAPGHNTVLRKPDGSLFLVNHIREMNFTGKPEISTMQVRRMHLTSDGWPVTAALPYAGEVPQPVDASELLGHYERISLAPSVPQGIQHAHGFALLPGNRLEMGSIVGEWHQTGERTFQFRYGPHVEEAEALPGWDRDRDVPCLTLSSLSNRGIINWYKHID